jgi:hypothetical protein
MFAQQAPPGWNKQPEISEEDQERNEQWFKFCPNVIDLDEMKKNRSSCVMLPGNVYGKLPTHGKITKEQILQISLNARRKVWADHAIVVKAEQDRQEKYKDEIDANRKGFNKLVESLVPQYKHLYVAFHNGNVMKSALAHDDALEYAKIEPRIYIGFVEKKESKLVENFY